jgi:hypothetical protein
MLSAPKHIGSDKGPSASTARTSLDTLARPSSFRDPMQLLVTPSGGRQDVSADELRVRRFVSDYG